MSASLVGNSLGRHRYHSAVRAFDTFVTISLFVLLISAVLFSVYLGGMSTMLSDSGAPGIAVGGVFLAIFGIPVTAVTVYVAAVLLAWQADGLTFYYPIVAFGVMVVAAALVMVVSVGLIAMGQWIHERNASTAPAEASTATAREPKVLTYDRTHYFQEKNRDAELGVERHTGRRYLAVTMPQRGQEFREYFGLDKQTYEAFVAEPQDAIFLADRCRNGTYVTDRMPWADAGAASDSSAATPAATNRTRERTRRTETDMCTFPGRSCALVMNGCPRWGERKRNVRASFSCAPPAPSRVRG